LDECWPSSREGKIDGRLSFGLSNRKKGRRIEETRTDSLITVDGKLALVGEVVVGEREGGKKAISRSQAHPGSFFLCEGGRFVRGRGGLLAFVKTCGKEKELGWDNRAVAAK